MTGTDDWLIEAIRIGSLRSVADGSYIKEMHPELVRAAVIMECSITGSRMIGSFPELSPNACTFWGGILGLLVMYLILLAMHKLHPDLGGQVMLYSDCLGVLRKVAGFPQSPLPSKTKHTNILKIVMIHFQSFSFDVSYQHV